MPELARIPQVLRRNEHKYTREINACHAAMLELFGINPKLWPKIQKKKESVIPGRYGFPEMLIPALAGENLVLYFCSLLIYTPS